MLINALVKQITLYDDKIIIQYNSPVKAGPDESRDFFFYRRTVEMPYVRQNKKELQYREFTLMFFVGQELFNLFLLNRGFGSLPLRRNFAIAV